MLSESSMSLEVGVYSSHKVRQEVKGPPPQGGFSRQFRIGVCRQSSQTLTLFKGRKSRFDTLFKAQNQKNGARFKGVTSACTAIRPFKIAVLNLETCIQACSTVLIDLIFFVLRVGVDTAIGHFRVHVCLLFKTSLSAKFL